MAYFSQYLHELIAFNVGLDTLQEKNIKDGAELININALEEQQLMVLPRFWQFTTKSIIRFRGNFEPFQYIEDLIKIKGICPAILKPLKKLIII